MPPLAGESAIRKQSKYFLREIDLLVDALRKLSSGFLTICEIRTLQTTRCGGLTSYSYKLTSKPNKIALY